MHQFLPGQRCVCDAELQLGLGTVLSIELRTITVLFLATGDTRTYAVQSAPLTRVEFGPGDTITTHTGIKVKIDQVRNIEGLLVYTGKDQDGNFIEVEEAQLDNFLQLNRPSERLLNGQIDPDKWFELRYQALEHISRISHSRLYGITGCRTSLIPHQLYIAHEVANRYAPRVLLADEVGLGKTIEAGLILHQQLLTERVSRVLIVVPETLVHQWLVEMLRRFNLHFRIFDDERWQSLTQNESDQEYNPFETEQLVLCSLKFITSDQACFNHCLKANWDMMIIDEAHHLEWTPDYQSKEYNAIDQLAKITKGVLLLTATPEQLGKQGHFARLRLLDPDRFPDYEKFIQEEDRYEPVAKVIEDLLTDKPVSNQDIKIIENTFNEGDNESELNILLKTDLNSLENNNARLELVEHLLDRHGTGRVLFRNTRHAVKGFPVRKVYGYPLKTPEEYRQIEENINTILLDDLLTPEIQYLTNSRQHWDEIDNRLVWLSNKLNELHPEKVLVITVHATTALDIVQYIKKNTGLRAAAFHEGLSIIERDRAAAAFSDRETGAHVLVCSEIGSEGRNFQFAHHVVLFDLPLNPDLLEQRIGRLDRIGQTETIHIHVPYLENTAQDVLFHWYHNGLNAFEQTCPVGNTVYTTLKDSLEFALKNPQKDHVELTNKTRSIYQELIQILQKGRDRLLEYNSCRTHIAQELYQQAYDLDKASNIKKLHDFMENAFDCFGINTEIHSENCLILSPTEHMIHQFPGVSDDGMTVTYHRQTALSFEDAHFLTWEHPLVLSTLDMIIQNEKGNTALSAMKYQGVRPGTLLVEALYCLEVAPVEHLATHRYLPPTTIRIVVDEQGVDHNERLKHEIINQRVTSVDSVTAQKVIKAKVAIIKILVENAGRLANSKKPEILKAAHQASGDMINREINRLKALSQINPNVRQDEILYFEQQLTALNQMIDQAALRLDALRVIVVI